MTCLCSCSARRSAPCSAVPGPLAAGGTAAGAYGSSQAVKDLLGGLFHYVAGEPGEGQEGGDGVREGRGGRQGTRGEHSGSWAQAGRRRRGGAGGTADPAGCAGDGGRRGQAEGRLLRHDMMRDRTPSPRCLAAVEPPPEAEQQRILARLHPALAPLLPHAMDTLTLVRAAYGQLPRGQPVGEAVAAAVAAGGVAPGGGAWGFSVGRHFSIRDLLKWCRRMGSVRCAWTPASHVQLGAGCQLSEALLLPGCRTATWRLGVATLAAPSLPSSPAAARHAAAALPQAGPLRSVPRLHGGGARGREGGRVCGGSRLLCRPAGPRRGGWGGQLGRLGWDRPGTHMAIVQPKHA